jgi:predicted nucleotidyltransferase component of viral defense system
MIPKAQILDFARRLQLLPTTVEKDYVLGWLLTAISQHATLSSWAFKGGTCLKKCYFETYRFSEDLDFTIPAELDISAESIASGLHELMTWIEAHTGLKCPRDGCDVEEYDNPRGKKSYQAKITYVGPLSLPSKSLQRVKFDLTQDELLADSPDFRELFHPYDDRQVPSPRIRCYSVNEILAEKARALYERRGRARDVYDIIHVSRDFRESIDATRAARLAYQKFEYKGLRAPTVSLILGRIESATLRADWEQQLRHQVPHLPPVEGFLADLPGALAWWLDPEHAPADLAPISAATNETRVRREYFPSVLTTAPQPLRVRSPLPTTGESLEQIRFAARNRLCAEILYHGATRVIEPYSLRLPRTGNSLLYGFELSRNGQSSNQIKAYRVAEIQTAGITETPFSPRYLVEL